MPWSRIEPAPDMLQLSSRDFASIRNPAAKLFTQPPAQDGRACAPPLLTKPCSGAALPKNRRDYQRSRLFQTPSHKVAILIFHPEPSSTIIFFYPRRYNDAGSQVSFIFAVQDMACVLYEHIGIQ